MYLYHVIWVRKVLCSFAKLNLLMDFLAAMYHSSSSTPRRFSAALCRLKTTVAVRQVIGSSSLV